MVEATKLLLNLEECPRVVDRGLDLQVVAHNAGILKQLVDSTFVEARYLGRVKASISLPIRVAFLQYSQLAQPGLCTL